MSLQTEDDPDLRLVMGAAETIGVQDGVLFTRFAEAVVIGSKEQLGAARAALADKLGSAAIVDAAAVAALFNAINRIADAIGVRFEASKLERTAGLRRQLHLDELPTARLPHQK